MPHHQRTAMKKLVLEASLDNLDRVREFVDEELEAAECSMKLQMQIDLAVEELFVNIANYAYAPGTGQAQIGIEILQDPRRMLLQFIDSGMPYNPVEKTDPDTTLAAEDRQIGGLGIFLAKKIMDGMKYERKDGQNYLCVWKELD